MPEWMPIILQGGFAGILLVVLWFGGKWIGAWLNNSQKFQQGMIIRSEEQQKDMSNAWVAMLGEVAQTNAEFADRIRALTDQNREVTVKQTEAIKQLCDRMSTHAANTGQRDEVMISQLQQIVEQTSRKN